MVRRRTFAALAVLVGVWVPLMAQDAASVLGWKFEKDKTFYQSMTTTTTQKMTVANNPVEQKQTQTFYFAWTPEKQDGDKWVVKQKIIGVAMEIDIGGSKINYNSMKEPAGATNPVGEFFKALVGSEFRLTINAPKGKEATIEKIEGRDEFLKKLGNANPQMQPLLNQILSENALKQMAQPTFGVLPNKDVKDLKKDETTWSHEATLEMGPIGKYVTKYEYKYLGKEGDLEKIGITATTTYKEPAPNDPNAGGLPFKILEGSELKSEPSKGTVYFDPKTGRITKSDMDMTLSGKLKIDISGQKTDVELSQKQNTKTETFDKDPTEKK